MSIQEIHQPYFLQRVEVSTDFATLSRMQVLPGVSAGKSVLHIGCVDWPITDVHANLHLAVDKVASHLVGVDLAEEAFDQLRPHLRHRELYTSIGDVPEQHFDLVLVPEVLEHVANIGDFLAEIDTVDFDALLISVPDAFSCAQLHFEYDGSSGEFLEAVHPDHNVWFTPYTLKNAIQKYTPWQIQKMYFIGGMSIMAFCTKRPIVPPPAPEPSRRSDLGLNTLD